MKGWTRRELLRSALMMSMLAPVSWAAPPLSSAAQAGDYASASGLGKRGRLLVGRLSDLILPATDTPGATEAGVVEFVDLILKAWASDDQRQRFVQGLMNFDAQAQAQAGKAFEQLPGDAQYALVDGLDRAAFPLDPGKPLPFILLMKSLTLAGYYTSQVGASQELTLNLVSGHYVPCGKPEQGAKAESILPSYHLTGFN